MRKLNRVIGVRAVDENQDILDIDSSIDRFGNGSIFGVTFQINHIEDN